MDLSNVALDELKEEIKRRGDEQKRQIIKGVVANIIEAEKRGDIMDIRRTPKYEGHLAYLIIMKQ